MDNILAMPQGGSLDLTARFEGLRSRCDHRGGQEASTSSTGPAARTGVEKAAELVLEYKRNLENGLRQFVALNSQLRLLETESGGGPSSSDGASRRLDFGGAVEDEDDASGDGGAGAGQVEVMRETLTHIEKTFKRDLMKLKGLVPFIKGVEARTPMRSHLRQNIQTTCTVYLNHYTLAWKEVLDMPHDADASDGSLEPASVAEFLLRMYFHLERSEQCVDGSQLYMEKLRGLVVESQRLRSHVCQCLDVALKSRKSEDDGLGQVCSPCAKDRIHRRRTRPGTFKDEAILDKLFQQKFFDFVADLKELVTAEYKAIMAVAADRKYRVLYDHDALEVVGNTLEEVVPRFLDFLTQKQQALSGKRRTIIGQVASALHYSPSGK